MEARDEEEVRDGEEYLKFMCEEAVKGYNAGKYENDTFEGYNGSQDKTSSVQPFHHQLDYPRIHTSTTNLDTRPPPGFPPSLPLPHPPRYQVQPRFVEHQVGQAQIDQSQHQNPGTELVPAQAFHHQLDNPIIHTSTTNLDARPPLGFPPPLLHPPRHQVQQPHFVGRHQARQGQTYRPPLQRLRSSAQQALPRVVPAPAYQAHLLAVEAQTRQAEAQARYSRFTRAQAEVRRLHFLQNQAWYPYPRNQFHDQIPRLHQHNQLQSQIPRPRQADLVQSQVHHPGQPNQVHKEVQHLDQRAQQLKTHIQRLQQHRDQLNNQVQHLHQSSQLNQPDLRQDRAIMAAPKPNDCTPRQRNLSPHDIGLLAQRAGRRNGSEGNLTPALTPNASRSETFQPHLPQNVLGTARTSTPYASQRSLSHGNPRPPSTLPQASGELRIPRTRHVDKGLGYDLGLDSNMPSQLPRNPHEAAAAARSHSSRVRAMQRNLAADPNVMLPPAPGFPSQLTAVGPPLTGHDTTTTNTLPSVLMPFHRQPMMSYKEGLQAIIDETGPLLFRLTYLDPMPVSVVFHDTEAHSIGISEGLILTKKTDLKSLITTVQELLDEQCKLSAGHDGGRLIVNIIEIRSGTKETKKGWPALKGESMRSQGEGKFAAWVRWITTGDMENYWQAYRIELQTQAPQPDKPGSSSAFVKPIFKVRTVRQVSNPSHPGGHEFLADPNVAVTPAAVLDTDQGQEDGQCDGGVALKTIIRRAIASTGAEADLTTGMGELGLQDEDAASSASSSLSTCGRSSIVTQGFGGYANAGSSVSANNSLSSFNQRRFGGDAAGSIPRSTNSNGSSGKDGGVVPESSKPKQKPTPVDSLKDWGYYQRMGGDPAMHKLYDLSHVPFEVANVREIATLPITAEMLRQAKQSWDGYDTQDSTDPVGPVRAVLTAEEEKWRAEEMRIFERAISFEDTDSWFPCYDTEIPDARKLVASRLMGQDKQLSAKGKGKGKAKETPTNNSFNGNCTPGSSQGHLAYGGFDSPQYQGKGKMNETEDNTYFSGHVAPDRGGEGLLGSKVAKHDGHGVGQTHDNSPINSSAGAGPSSGQDYVLPNLGVRVNSPALLQTPVAAASMRLANSMKSPNTKVSLMNVHAPDFNYQQHMDRSNTNGFSPYLQSLAGPQASYTKPDSYGHMAAQAGYGTPGSQYSSPAMLAQAGQAGYGTPGTQYSSPAMAGNQRSSLQQSSSFTANFPFDYPQQSNSAMQQSQGKQRGSSSTSKFPFDFRLDGGMPYPQHSSPAMQHSPTKQYAVQYGSPKKNTFSNTGNSSVPRYGSPEKSIQTGAPNYSRRQFLGTQYNQEGKGSGSRSRSPEKSGPARQTAPAPFFGYSPAADHSFNTGYPSFGFGQNMSATTTFRFPSPGTTNTRQQDFNNSGFKYPQDSQFDFAFNHHAPCQGSSNHGDQNSMMGGGQSAYNFGGQNSYQGWGSTSGDGPAQDGGKRQRHDF